MNHDTQLEIDAGLLRTKNTILCSVKIKYADGERDSLFVFDEDLTRIAAEAGLSKDATLQVLKSGSTLETDQASYRKYR